MLSSALLYFTSGEAPLCNQQGMLNERSEGGRGLRGCVRPPDKKGCEGGCKRPPKPKIMRVGCLLALGSMRPLDVMLHKI